MGRFMSGGWWHHTTGKKLAAVNCQQRRFSVPRKDYSQPVTDHLKIKIEVHYVVSFAGVARETNDGDNTSSGKAELHRRVVSDGMRRTSSLVNKEGYLLTSIN